MKLNLFYAKDRSTKPVYSIRHTFATELYKKGYSIESIATENIDKLEIMR